MPSNLSLSFPSLKNFCNIPFRFAMTLTPSIARGPQALRSLVRLLLETEQYPFRCFASRNQNSMKLRNNKVHSIVDQTKQRRLRTPTPPPRRTNPGKCIPERPIRETDRITKWPRDLRYSKPKGLRNPGNYCYRRSVLQCLLQLPALYSYLGLSHTFCTEPVDTCTMCALQALMQKYWNDRNRNDFPGPEPGAHGAVDALDHAFNSSCPVNSAFKDFATPNVRGDPHEFLTYLLDQLATREPRR